MKKLFNSKFLIVVFICACISTARLFAQEINFISGDYQAAREQAKESKKLIFVDAYTTWCGPCKWMAKNVFTNPEVAAFYNASFVCLKLDMEKGQGVEFAQKFDVNSYPTFLFIDAEGNRVHQTCGKKEASAFIKDGKDALVPEAQLITFQKRYDKGGEFELSFLKTYAGMLSNAGINAAQIMDLLVSHNSATDLLNKEDFYLLSEYAELGNKPFEFIQQYREKYEGMIGTNDYTQFIHSVFLAEAVRAAKSKTPDQLDKAKELVQKYGLENNGELLAHMDWEYAQIEKSNLFQAAQTYIESYKMEDAAELNNAAWAIYENSNEMRHVEIASDWSLKSVKLDRSYANTDTYAHLLSRLGREDEAMAMARVSIDLGKKSNEDTRETEALLKQLESSKKPRK
jgi:thioredoxin-related protein